MGTRDRRGGGPVSADDAYVVASVSKAFTAALLLELVHRHQVALDDPVTLYVPGWDRRITIRDLLTHRSGLTTWGNADDDPAAQQLYDQLERLVIEKATNLSLAAAFQRYLLEPLGLRHTFKRIGFAATRPAPRSEWSTTLAATRPR